MSHTLHQPSTMIHPEHIAAAAEALGWEVSDETSAVFYDRTRHEGTVVKAPNWRYPIVVKADGSVVFDDYNGSWGDAKEIVRFKDEYTFSVAEEVYAAREDGIWHVEHRGYGDNGKLQAYAWCEE